MVTFLFSYLTDKIFLKAMNFFWKKKWDPPKMEKFWEWQFCWRFDLKWGQKWLWIKFTVPSDGIDEILFTRCEKFCKNSSRTYPILRARQNVFKARVCDITADIICVNLISKTLRKAKHFQTFLSIRRESLHKVKRSDGLIYTAR